MAPPDPAQMDTHKRTREDILDEAAAIMAGALPATPDDGLVETSRVRDALRRLGELQAKLPPGSREWELIGDCAESLVPALHSS
jgi:hypothetical protein